MTTQRNAGPNRMRLWADYIEQNVKHHLLPLAVKNPDTLRELAAQWDADRAEAQEIRQLGMRYMVDLASMTARAERAEAALEVAQAKADVIGGQACAEARAAGRGPCGCCAWCVKQATERAERAEAALEQLQDALSVRDHQYLAARAEIVAQRAALERARALAEKWADMKYNGDLTTAVYHGCAEELAAVLASGSDAAIKAVTL